MKSLLLALAALITVQPLAVAVEGVTEKELTRCYEAAEVKVFGDYAQQHALPWIVPGTALALGAYAYYYNKAWDLRNKGDPAILDAFTKVFFELLAAQKKKNQEEDEFLRKNPNLGKPN